MLRRDDAMFDRNYEPRAEATYKYPRVASFLPPPPPGKFRAGQNLPRFFPSAWKLSVLVRGRPGLTPNRFAP